MSSRDHIIQKTRRMVIKVGSSIFSECPGSQSFFFTGLAKEIAGLIKKRIEVVLVSSGAIACGMEAAALSYRPKKIPQKQAIAAMGQPLLMQRYAQAFIKRKIRTAQILVTRNDLENRERFLNAKHAFMELFHYGVVPIVNENDSVSVEEIQFGDNDQLSAMVAHLVDADLLLILTDIDGLYDADPKKNKKARRISVVERIDEEIFKLAGGSTNLTSTGGMATKLKAARLASEYGVPTWIVSGNDPGIITQVFAKADCGTLFISRQDALSSRKYWIAYANKPKGELLVDAGAAQALTHGNKSLLASGIVGLNGEFKIGDSVDVVFGEPTQVIGRGLINYHASEVDKIKGIQSADIEKILGYKYYDEVIHRDNLVIF